MKQQHGWHFPDADVHMLEQLRPDQSYQLPNLEGALRFVTDWSIAFDGGAHTGTWSRLLAAKFARVIAVEPSPDTYEALVENMRQAGCQNVETQQVAVGAAPGRVSMNWDATAQRIANTGARFVTEGGLIPRITIDSLGLPSLGFLKLDIEGSEHLALAGASETLQRCRPIVLFEDKKFCKRFGARGNAPHTWLMAHRYQPLRRIGSDEIWGPKP